MADKLKHTLDGEMSAQGIARRLRRLGQLHALARSLQKAKPLKIAESPADYGKGAARKPMGNDARP